jgi:single-strand DNA-binding protein
MASLNRVSLIGNLTKDPEVRFTGQGTAVASFSVATDESYKKDGAKVEQTEFHNITAWGKLAELSGEYLQKGSQVFLEGKLKTDKVEKDGVTKYYTKIVASDITFLARTKGKGSEPKMPEAEDNVPF